MGHQDLLVKDLNYSQSNSSKLRGINTYQLCSSVLIANIHTHIHTYIYTRIHISAHANTHTYPHIHTNTRTHGLLVSHAYTHKHK